MAAILVACDKDALDQDITNINVLEQAEEINASIDSNEAFDFINNLNSAIVSGDIEVSPKTSKGNSSTAKAGDFGTNWIQVIFFDYTLSPALGERRYAYVRSDNHGVICPDATEDASTSFSDVMLNPVEVSYTLAPHPTTALNNAGFRQLIIETISAAGTVSSSSNVQSSEWGSTFSADFDRTYATASGAIAGGFFPAASRFDVACVTGSPEPEWGESPTDPGLFIHSIHGSYRLSAAPFPLTGVLATVVSDDTTSDDTNNYAGSGSYGVSGTPDDVQAVRNAIEADFIR